MPGPKARIKKRMQSLYLTVEQATVQFKGTLALLQTRFQFHDISHLRVR